MSKQNWTKLQLFTVGEDEDTAEVAFCDLPDPYPISDIKPTLKAFRRNNEFTYEYEENPAITVESMERDGYLDLNRIVFIVHGFCDDSEATKWKVMKNEILKVEDQTVVIVGWEEGADITLLRYKKACANTQPVGVWLGEVAKEIKRKRANITVWGIGHSIGAHLLGKAGRESKSFDRITGLDPAGPVFEKECEQIRLNKADANMVDAIHTDGYDSTILWLDHYGSLVPCGTVDFYPNFGYQQPGRGALDIAGSHSSVIDYFIWSISNPGKFATNFVLDGTPAYMKPISKAKPVKETAEMGYHALANHRGLFYVKTNKSNPWTPVKRKSRSCTLI